MNGKWNVLLLELLGYKMNRNIEQYYWLFRCVSSLGIDNENYKFISYDVSADQQLSFSFKCYCKSYFICAVVHYFVNGYVYWLIHSERLHNSDYNNHILYTKLTIPSTIRYGDNWQRLVAADEIF